VVLPAGAAEGVCEAVVSEGVWLEAGAGLVCVVGVVDCCEKAAVTGTERRAARASMRM